MASKPEIYLEIGTGFFRIPTSEANYNISVLNTAETSVTRIVEKIVEQEKESQATDFSENAMSAVAAGFDEGGDDGFYRDVSKGIYNEIGTLAKSLSTTMMDIPAEDRKGKRIELDEAGHKIEDAKSQLKDIVEMTEKAAMKIMDKVEDVQGRSNEVQDLLSNLKNHTAFTIFEKIIEGENEVEDKFSAAKDEIEAQQGQMRQAMDLLSAIEGNPAEPEIQEEAAPPVPEVKVEKKTRFLFDLDVVFQTLYELCTNETVKDHITSARERREEIFDVNVFYDDISPKAAKYEADSDNFFTAPMSDFFDSLQVACSDKGISNLLKKMDSGQSSIFLDQTIPLEVPPTEEIEVEAPSMSEPPVVQAPAKPDPRIAEVKDILAAAMDRGTSLPGLIDEGSELSCGGRAMTVEDQQEVFRKIEDAFGIATTISGDVAMITEALSFQDLSGQQILKIIKLLSDFQVQLLALVVSFGSQLKHKEENADISVEESKKLAQNDVDSYINKLSGGGEGDEDGMLDQDTVNSMLEEMGF